MAYVKQNFVDGAVLNASELNHMEDGIGNAYIKPSGGIPSSDIASNAITAPKIASNAVSTMYTATIPHSSVSWQTVGDWYATILTVNGLLATDTPDIGVNPTIDEDDPTAVALAAQNIIDWEKRKFAYVPAADTLVILFEEIPEADVPIMIRCVRK